MKKLLLSLLALSLLLTPAFGAQRLLGSVQLLRVNGKGRCTIFAINTDDKLWATAKHRVVGAGLHIDNEPTYTIGIGTLRPIYVSPMPDDIAVFEAERAGIEIRLADK